MSRAVPQLDTTSMPGQPDVAALPTPHIKSGRRLSKSVMRTDSADAEGSKGHGMAILRDGSGTERAVRVVQKAEAEDFNMFKVTWLWTDNNKTYQVDMRHGRRSGIRKIYVNKEQIERQRNMKDFIADTGSTHAFIVGGHDAEIRIQPKSMAGFMYQLLIDGNPIEQNLAGPMTQGPLDIGVRPVQLPKSDAGLGMTLRNNPLGNTGVVVWTVEPGKAAESAGVMVGDCVLSIEEHIVDSIDNLVEYVGQCQGMVNMELAGSARSRNVAMSKKRPGNESERDSSKPYPIGLGLQTTSCGVGILVTEIDTGSAASVSELVVGDCILSIDSQVPTSPKHAVALILAAKDVVQFVVIGNQQETMIS